MKKSFYAAAIGGMLMLFGFLYACKEGVNPTETILTAEQLAADATFKDFAILSQEMKKGYAILNPTNTKEDKNKIMEELKRLKKTTNPAEKLKLLNLLGYNSEESFRDHVRLYLQSSTVLRDKFPALKTMNQKDYSELLAKANFLLRKELPYRIHPNQYRVISIYTQEEWLRMRANRLQTRASEPWCDAQYQDCLYWAGVSYDNSMQGIAAQGWCCMNNEEPCCENSGYFDIVRQIEAALNIEMGSCNAWLDCG
jgi:hypothetical protein